MLLKPCPLGRTIFERLLQQIFHRFNKPPAFQRRYAPLLSESRSKEPSRHRNDRSLENMEQADF